MLLLVSTTVVPAVLVGPVVEPVGTGKSFVVLICGFVAVLEVVVDVVDVVVVIVVVV